MKTVYDVWLEVIRDQRRLHVNMIRHNLSSHIEYKNYIDISNAANKLAEGIFSIIRDVDDSKIEIMKKCILSEKVE